MAGRRVLMQHELPHGWSRLTTVQGYVTGYLSNAGAAMPTDGGGWVICPCNNQGQVMTSEALEGIKFDDPYAAIMAVEMRWPRR